jgi:DNA (cytosine-5)-methyltransferase 1
MTLKIFEAFAGYGGASFGLKKAGIKYKVIGFSEIDKYAAQLYENNHKGALNFGDITKIETNKIKDFDLFTGGFPCQPFSNAGKGLGENDDRGTLFKDIIRICSDKKPKYVLLENVKGFVTKRHKPTLDKLVEEFTNLGYTITHKVLNSAEFGNAQTRQRFWFLAILNPKNDISKYLEIEKSTNRPKFIDFLDENPSPELYLNQDQCRHLIKKHNVDLNVPTSLCLDIYNKKIKYDEVCITLTEPHHNGLRVVEPMLNNEFKVRKLSINEMFRLMGINENEISTDGFSYFQLAKRAANGWDVIITKQIMENIFKTHESI